MFLLSTFSLTVTGSFEIHVQSIDEQPSNPLLAPVLEYFPIEYDFGNVTEGGHYKTIFDIWNAGTDTLMWSLEIDEDWLTANPITGDSTGENDTVLVEINTTDLEDGVYTGTIEINANIPGEPQYFTVYFQIGIGNNSPPNTPEDLVGPTEVEEDEPNLYYTSATDPDDDPIRYGFDFNNDGIIETDHWTGYEESGETVTIEITFGSTGTFDVRVKAEDIHGLQSNFSNPLTVTVGGSNDPPNTPNKPTGPNSGNIDVPYTYSTSATDPNDDTIRYGWDWNGDGLIDEYSGYVDSGTTDTRSHTWTAPGTYHVKVLAEDEHGGQSEFSIATTIEIVSNQEPEKPTITGPSSGRVGKSYIYTGSGIDPDGDQIYYLFDWGDGTTTGWTGPYNSGQTASESHKWTAQGTYSVKVKTKDSNDVESIWSDTLPVSMPKYKITTDFFSLYIYKLQQLYPILKILFI